MLHEVCPSQFVKFQLDLRRHLNVPASSDCAKWLGSGLLAGYAYRLSQARVRRGRQESQRLKISEVLIPPKAKLLDMIYVG